jgi:hypothetical protein
VNGKKALPPGFKAIAAFFKAAKPVKRARVPGRANEEVENIIGITPELLTCIVITRYISTQKNVGYILLKIAIQFFFQIKHKKRP